MSPATEKAFAANVLDITGGRASYQPASSPTMWRRLTIAPQKDLLRPIREEGDGEQQLKIDRQIATWSDILLLV
jgi:hypothetical protein